MILADKIISLRKKNGWSQEELAEKMNVSRQAVSKWEGAQTIPDLGKILQLARLFGVTTDYLLKDELETAEHTREDEQPDLRKIGMEEAGVYLESRVAAAKRIALGALLCILSPIPLFLLGGATEENWGIHEGFALGVGLVSLILMVMAAVALFVYTGFQNAPYEFLEKNEDFELEYGVAGMVREKQKAYRKDYVLGMVISVCLCVISPVPLLLGAFGGIGFQLVALLCVTMGIVGCGVYGLVRNGVRWASMQKLLQEGEYQKKEKESNSVRETVSSVYWLILTAIYLGWSFLSNDWHITWVVFAVGGVLFAALDRACDLWNKRK